MLGWISERIARENLGTPEPIETKAAPRRRSYAGAAGSRLLADFVASTTSADGEIRYNLRRLRDRSRELSRNNDYMRRYLQLLSQNVVGEHGFQLQSRARNERKPGEERGSLDASGNAIVENAWKRWGKRCTTDRRHSWLDVQRLVIEGLARDGEILIRFVRGRGYPNGFALQLLEPDYLDETYTTTAPGGKRINMGVELDQYDAPVAYYLLLGKNSGAHPFDDAATSVKSTARVRVPASEIIHLYMPERSQQTRGVPWISASMARMKMLDGLEEATIVAARAGASKMGFITSPDGDQFIGEDEDIYNPVMSAEPGSIQQLPAGMSFTPWNPDYPASSFSDFHKSILRGIASGLGVSYVSLANNLEGVSYSSIRQGALEERDFYRTIQTFVIQHLCEPICEEWLSMFMSQADTPLPVSKFDKFASALEFRGRGFAWIDPAKEIKAEHEAVQSGFKSLNDVARSYGRDVEEVFAQMQADKAMAERYGIQLAYEPLGTGVKNQQLELLNAIGNVPEA